MMKEYQKYKKIVNTRQTYFITEKRIQKEICGAFAKVSGQSDTKSWRYGAKHGIFYRDLSLRSFGKDKNNPAFFLRNNPKCVIRKIFHTVRNNEKQ